MPANQPDIRVVMGLGNPGTAYRYTRHNAGAIVLTSLSERLHIPLRTGKGNYLLGEGEDHSIPFVLVFPLAFMNNSGTVVREIQMQYQCDSARLLIISDEFALPFGTLRFRARGTSGGHRGLQSVIDRLQTEEVPRLRVGIGREDEPEDKSDFVLSKFTQEERDLLPGIAKTASDGVLDWAANGIEYVMTKYNHKTVNGTSGQKGT